MPRDPTTENPLRSISRLPVPNPVNFLLSDENLSQWRGGRRPKPAFKSKQRKTRWNNQSRRSLNGTCWRPVGSIYFMLKWRIATSRSHRHEECSATYACNEDLWLKWIRTTFRSRT